MKVYFFTVEQGPVEASGYEHCLIALAEGFKTLGVEFAGNRNYWPMGSGWLIPQSACDVLEYDVLLVSSEWLHRYGTLPKEYLEAKGKKRVYVDVTDGWRTPALTDPEWPADLILRTHFIRRHRYDARVKPWAFGLTERILTALGSVPSPADRPSSVLCNFRIGHPVRDLMTYRFRKNLPEGWLWDDKMDREIPQDPADKLLWSLTGARHYPAYYRRLKKSRVCLAFGGYFSPKGADSPSSPLGKAAYRLIQTTKWETGTLGQFDSWRLWESLASGAITVHLPLESYGCLLPVMPEEGVDYLAFDGKERPGETEAALASLSQSCRGSHWAREHYSPEPTAKRLLEWIS